MAGASAAVAAPSLFKVLIQRRSVALGLAILAVVLFAAVFADVIAPHDPGVMSVRNRLKPPSAEWWFGTDEFGRDVFTRLIYAGRVSLIVGISATLFATFVGVSLGLLAGYVGGHLDSVLMRICDIQLTFPSILVALLVDGITRAALPREVHDQIALFVVIFAIGISEWPKFARTVRGSTLVERNKEYVQAARVIGVPSLRIMASHVLPNVVGPVLVVATLNLGLAILSEATLSFLGVGVPPTQPSLGTLIRIGNDFLFSGEWWITIFPGIALIAMVLSVNLLGDWLRDALNPKLR